MTFNFSVISCLGTFPGSNLSTFFVNVITFSAHCGISVSVGATLADTDDTCRCESIRFGWLEYCTF